MMTRDEMRSAMRSYGKVPADHIEMALDMLHACRAAAAIVGARPIGSNSYIRFVDANGLGIAYLHVHYIDIHQDYADGSGFQAEPYERMRRLPFPSYAESQSRKAQDKRPPLCAKCHNAPDYCERP
jgi:hypothetical protein